MKPRFFAAICAFAASIGAGYMIGLHSWGGKVFIAGDRFSENPRNPAAIRKDLDFSQLDGAELLTATQKRLVSAAKVYLHGGDIGVGLGHFVTRGADGQRKLACDSLYNRLTLVFEADGIADAGEKPVMEIDSVCRTSSRDIASIEPIWIPVPKIVAERPTDMDLSYDESAKFRFEHMSTDWPKRWILSSVRLYNSEEAGREVKISSSELREIRERPLILEWARADAEPAPTGVQ